jgi:hypothetical protein
MSAMISCAFGMLYRLKFWKWSLNNSTRGMVASL